jgi:hypothetical protein
MNRCQYCGKEYADNVTVCLIDGQPVVARKTNPETSSKTAVVPRADPQAAFYATLVLPISASGVYRIYIRSGDLIFIMIEGGTTSILNSIHGLLGPLGAIIPLFLWLFGRHRTRDWKRRVAEADPEDLIRENEKNFRLHLSEIREATLEPPSFWQLHGKQVGQLHLLIRQNETMRLELGSPDDLETARQLLTPLLHSTFRVNLEWNAAKGRFEKKKADTAGLAIGDGG